MVFDAPAPVPPSGHLVTSHAVLERLGRQESATLPGRPSTTHCTVSPSTTATPLKSRWSWARWRCRCLSRPTAAALWSGCTWTRGCASPEATRAACSSTPGTRRLGDARALTALCPAPLAPSTPDAQSLSPFLRPRSGRPHQRATDISFPFRCTWHLRNESLMSTPLVPHGRMYATSAQAPARQLLRQVGAAPLLKY